MIIKIRIQTAIRQSLLPAVKIKDIGPAVKALSPLPGQIQSLSQTPVAPGKHALHDAGLAVMVLQEHVFYTGRFNQQSLFSPNLCQRILRHPLKRGIGLWYKRRNADRDLATALPRDLLIFPLHLAGQLRNGHYILVRLTRQTDHKVQLDLFPAIGKGRADRLQQVVFRHALVNHIPHSLTAGLRRKSKPALPHRLHLLRHIDAEGINTQTGQRHADFFLFEILDHFI